MVEQELIDSKEIEDLIWSLLRSFRSGFNTCKLIQEAISYKGRIPKDFWLDEHKGYDGILGMKNISKKEMKEIHKEVVEIIIKEINEPKTKMFSDHYSRLFHALAILKVEKSDPRITVPKPRSNEMYIIAYNLWLLDDGTDSTYQPIDLVSWHASEIAKLLVKK